MEKTLYVTDLDGTLLNRQDRVSPFSIRTINELVKKGMLFTYATARSLVSASKVTEGLSTNIPVIAYNGAFILQPSSGAVLAREDFTAEERSRSMPSSTALKRCRGSRSLRTTGSAATSASGRETAGSGPFPAGTRFTKERSSITPASAKRKNCSRSSTFLPETPGTAAPCSRNCTGRNTGARSCPPGLPRPTPSGS